MTTGLSSALLLLVRPGDGRSQGRVELLEREQQFAVDLVGTRDSDGTRPDVIMCDLMMKLDREERPQLIETPFKRSKRRRAVTERLQNSALSVP